MPKHGEGVEQALSSTEQELRLLVETIPTLVWRAAPDGSIEYVNRRVLDYFGAPLGEIVGWGWAERVHPEDVAFKLKSWLETLETKTPHSVVCRFRGADGQYRWFNVRGEPLRADDGTVLRWYGVLIDIDEAKKSEELLRRSEALLTEAQRLSHSGALATNESTILYFSEEAYRIWGFDPALGPPSREAMLQRIHPDDRDWVLAEAERGSREKRGYSTGYRILMPDGTVKHVESIREPVFSPSGELVEIVATQIDVTERKRAEEVLRESEHKLRQIFETVPGLLWSTNPAGEPTQLNQRLLDYTGSRFEDFVQGGWETFLHPDDIAATTRAFGHAILTGTSHEIVHRFRRADGEFHWHHTRAEPLRDQQGRVIQWYGLSVDIDEGKRAADQLRRSEAHLAEAQRLSHTGASAYDESTIFYWSEETFRIWGFDPALGIPNREAVFQRVHPDDRERLRAEIDRIFLDKSGSSSEFRIVLPDGTVKHLESIREPVFSPSGELVEIVGTQIDVTERKRAVEALRESEHKLRQIFETVPALLWSTDPAGEPTQLNQRFLDYTGLRFEDFMHGGWEAFLHPDDFPETARIFNHAIQTGTSHEILHRFRRADGEFRWHHTRGEPLRDRQGRITQWYGLCVDIDAAKKAEDRLRRSEAHLAEAQRLSHSGASAFNESGILYWSEEMFRIWGFDPALGIPNREAAFQRVHPDDRDRMRAEVARALSEKTGSSSGFRIVLPDGTVKHLESIREPVFSPSGELVEIVGTQIDVTERKRAEEALMRLRQLESDLAHMNRLSMMGELAASLAHEITQPIATARNNARAAMNFLDKQPPEPDEVREALHSIVEDADRAGDIIDRIRNQIKKAPPRKSRFDLNEAINEVLRLARTSVIENKVSVQTRLTEPLFPVEGDRVQLQQVALNLILNAVEAMSAVEGAPRELLISTERTETGGVLVSVQDSGPGIDPDHLDRVFQAFYTTKSSGLGMGLSICRSIIDAHGGRLWADKNASGGSVLRFSLPGKELTRSRHSAREMDLPRSKSSSVQTSESARTR